MLQSVQKQEKKQMKQSSIETIVAYILVFVAISSLLIGLSELFLIPEPDYKVYEGTTYTSGSYGTEGQETEHYSSHYYNYEDKIKADKLKTRYFTLSIILSFILTSVGTYIVHKKKSST